ncbi:M20 family metallopeptidase [Catenuloplanes atrovinosus]|uniref:Glutamate carboxypeptidase n=1 Tax=Catenuloplanes atrovinosus TaxID=137266 RepID=A0AAE3YVP8_9ACTN|nr:M20 family metallopeptidase [Catenuloplanes atrovinosus]MDR7278886.1 glutamate carboxypeptidase [Catenuloplanes atrovinosus]
MTDDLATLVTVESPSVDERALAASAHVVAALGTRLLGTAPGRHGHHLVWRHGPTRVLVAGHHDTVWPVGTLDRWPFTIDGDRATGPGVFDMKAGLVQLFHGLSTLGSLDGVTVVVNADEEIGSIGSRDLIHRAAEGARAALICEPSATGGALKTARKGIARFRVEVTGRAAHAGLEPHLGVNAAVELAHQTLAVAALGRGDTTVTPTLATAGTSDNTVPAGAALTIDMRGFDPAEFTRVAGALRALRPVLPGAAVTVTGGVSRPPMPPGASADLHRLAHGAATALGQSPLPGVAVGGASDGNLTAARGVPTLDGLGAVGGNAHAEGEWVDLSAMPARAALLTRLISDILARG